MERTVLIEKYKTENIFYVYGYFDTREPGEYIYFDDKINLELKFDYEPFYIGKGQYNRMYDHLLPGKLKKNSHKSNKIKKIIKETNDIPVISMLQSGMTEQNALNLEIKFIALIGRENIKTGPLTNLKPGGQGTSGRRCSKETKEKQRQAKLGTKQSDETIAKRIKSGSEHWGFGKERSQETKDKIGKSNKGKPCWSQGIPCSEERKEKSRQKQLGKKLSAEQIEKISKNNAKFWLGKIMPREMVEKSKETKRKNYEININDINYKEKLSK